MSGWVKYALWVNAQHFLLWIMARVCACECLLWCNTFVGCECFSKPSFVNLPPPEWEEKKSGFSYSHHRYSDQQVSHGEGEGGVDPSAWVQNKLKINGNLLFLHSSSLSLKLYVCCFFPHFQNTKKILFQFHFGSCKIFFHSSPL